MRWHKKINHLLVSTNGTSHHVEKANVFPTIPQMIGYYWHKKKSLSGGERRERTAIIYLQA